MFKTLIRPFCEIDLLQIKGRMFSLFLFSDDPSLFLKKIESGFESEFMLIFAGGLIKV
jgi:hypothetical protein